MIFFLFTSIPFLSLLCLLFFSYGFKGIANPRVLTTLHPKDIEKIKANYKELTTQNKKRFKDLIQENKEYIEIREKKLEEYNKKIKAQIKGINPKTTRPFTNNDCGLLSPLDPEAIKRLRYVNLTCYDFRRVYELFYRAFYKRKGLAKECLIYADPPFPSKENYYGSKFKDEDHFDLIEIALDTPFHFMLSIGGDCEIYIDILGEAGWVIDPVKTKYSTDANTQKDTQEYICMNYDITELPLMQSPSEQKTIEKWAREEDNQDKDQDLTLKEWM